MKRKWLILFLIAEALALAVLLGLTERLPALFSSLLAFPFEQLGAGLRALSLTGRVGNGLALALLLGLSLLPLWPVLAHKGEKGRGAENAALAVTAGLLLFVLTAMANPGMLCNMLPDLGKAALPFLKAVLGGTVWSLLLCWAVLRLLRLFRAGSTEKLTAYLRVLLCGLCALFVGVIVLSCGGALFSALEAAQKPMDTVLAALRFLVAALPYGLDIAVTLSALTLLDARLSGERPAAVAAAERLSRLCCLALALTTLCVAGLNVLQLVLARYLSNILTTVSFPLMSLAFVLAALLLARLIAENGRLADENDGFI